MNSTVTTGLQVVYVPIVIEFWTEIFPLQVRVCLFFQLQSGDATSSFLVTSGVYSTYVTKWRCNEFLLQLMFYSVASAIVIELFLFASRIATDILFCCKCGCK
jgi:hypothetical protein